MNTIQVKVQPEHISVLKTLHDAGYIDKQTMQTIRGKVLEMSGDEAEKMLRKLIAKCGSAAKSQVAS